jgi:hypothetical protein
MIYEKSEDHLRLKKLNGRDMSSLSATEFYLFEEACRKNKATRLYGGHDHFFRGSAKVKVYERL